MKNIGTLAAIVGLVLGVGYLYQKQSSESSSIKDMFDNLASLVGSLGSGVSGAVSGVLDTVNTTDTASSSTTKSSSSTNTAAADTVNLAAAVKDYAGNLSIPYSGTLAGILDKNFVITSTGVTTKLTSIAQVQAIASTQSYAKAGTTKSGATVPTFNSQSGSDWYAQYLAANPSIASQYVKLNGLS